MDIKKHTISLCMGSSCYVNGSVTLLQFVKNYLKEKCLEQKVELKGCLCQDHCKHGPSVVIDGTLYTRIDSSLLGSILDKKILYSQGIIHE